MIILNLIWELCSFHRSLTFWGVHAWLKALNTWVGWLLQSSYYIYSKLLFLVSLITIIICVISTEGLPFHLHQGACMHAWFPSHLYKRRSPSMHPSIPPSSRRPSKEIDRIRMHVATIALHTPMGVVSWLCLTWHDIKTHAWYLLIFNIELGYSQSSISH